MSSDRYTVTIGPVGKPKVWPGCHFSISLRKNYGDCYGHGSCVSSKEQIIKLFQRMKKDWEGHDNCLDRHGDPVKPGNLHFEDATGTMEKLELFGNARLL